MAHVELYEQTEDSTLQHIAALKHLVLGNVSAAWPIAMEIMRVAPLVDPENNDRGNLDAILCLASLDVVGDRLWSFYMIACQREVVLLLAVLRAYRLGIAGITKDVIDVTINDESTFDFVSIVQAVREALPSFNPAAAPTR